MTYKLKRHCQNLSDITLHYIKCNISIYTDVARFTIPVLDLKKIH